MRGEVRRRFVTALVRIAALILASAWAASGMAATVIVDDDPGCSNLSTCGRGANPRCCKIQTAICNAVSGDLVQVKPGTYLESIRMRPGVPVVSEQGPSVTTIDATNKSCTSTDFCNPEPSGNCSAVLIGSSVGSNTRLEGFRITGGEGVPVTFGSVTKRLGGGVYCSGAAVITNNTITGNNLAGNEQYFYGAGVATVGTQAPLPAAQITNNTITGNNAKPPAGTVLSTFAYGGGIYAGYRSFPVIEANTITNNEAGDRTVLADTLGEGGGVFVMNKGDSGTTTVTRNLISGNRARDGGGGISVESYCASTCQHTRAVITNNEIRGNDAGVNAPDGEGGGLFTYFVTATIANNTVHSNTAGYGGGHHKGDQYIGTDNIVDANNIYSSNTSRVAGTGGGIHARVSCHPVRYTDFWQNAPQAVGGACTSTILSANGNQQVDPLYVNPAGNDFHLDISSLLVDSGNNADSPPNDRDGVPRPLDGNLDGSIIVDVGEYERDRDCDGDGTLNHRDADDDNDGDPDVTDCADCNPDRSTLEPEVCNSIDEDCDGTPDDGLGQTTCGVGQCRRTVQNCVGGNSQTCVPGSPSAEICNGLDDDCDGSTDEGLPPITCGLGECQRTVPACVGGVPQTCTPGAPSPEVCNGRDDDCNGAVDDNGDPDRDGLYNCQDPDDDNDGWLDGADCAPVVNSVHSQPGLVGSTLRFEDGSEVALYWTRVPQANVYDVYRGNIAPGGFAYNHICFERESPDQRTVDPSLPASNNVWYYLVAAKNSCGLGSLGNRSNGQPRPAGPPCGAGGEDTDLDGVGDIDDNCAMMDNGDQADGDLDTVGDICEGLDGDHDGVPDAADCAPADADTFGIPAEAVGLTAIGLGPTQIAWARPNLGSSVVYDLATGVVSAAHQDQFGPGTCLAGSLTQPSGTDSRPDPAAGVGYYYLARPRNSCGTGTYGTPSRDLHGTAGGDSCP